MPHIISIDGTVGADVFAKDVRASLAKAKGGEISVEVSSAGGDVLEMISVYNAIKNYEGPKETKIVGVAASAASYIALATDRVLAESNAVFMIHNAMGLAIGDHNNLRAKADLMERFSNQLVDVYSAKTGKSKKEIQALMDEETFFFGEEIKASGFADEIIQSESEDEKEDAVAFAKLSLEDCTAKIKSLKNSDDLEKIAAMLPTEQEPKPTPKGAVKMTPEEIAALQKENEEMKAKLEDQAKAEDEPKEEPKADEPAVEEKSGVEKALAILQSPIYSKNVKDIAAAVIKEDASESDLNIMVSAFDMVTEMVASKDAKTEADELEDTPADVNDTDPTKKNFLASVNAGKNIVNSQTGVQ